MVASRRVVSCIKTLTHLPRPVIIERMNRSVLRIWAAMSLAFLATCAAMGQTAGHGPRASVAQETIRQAQESADYFEREIRPLLAKRCYACHSSQTAQPGGRLRLDTPAGWLQGGRSGPALKPGDSASSLILRAVSWTSPNLKMPPAGRMSDAEIAALRSWVERGAYAPGPKAARSGRPPHWAFQPVKRPTLPTVRNSGWCITPIDRFVLASLEKRGMHPAEPADRRTLLRRVTFDLIGLPPTPGEIADFLADRSPNAYEKVVDRLLASPRYGERWARHWLDVVHYGDTHGYDKDKRRDNAWPYRDYVIRALNEDRPYSRFLQEQVAGDILFPNTADGIIATGFLAAGPWDFVGNVELAEGTVEKEKTRLLDRDDIVSNVMSTFNSVSIHCARCHDHKFDPIPQRDYYRLQAVFAGIERGDRPYGDEKSLAERAALDARERELVARRTELQKAIALLTSPQIARLDREIAELNRRAHELPPLPAAVASPTNGYHSGIEAKQDIEKWVQIDLGNSVAIDRIRLFPARPTDFLDTPGFGFPLRYKVAISDDPAFTHNEILLDHTSADTPNPGDVPIVIEAGARKARYVRVSAQKLWLRTSDYVFALAELQVDSAGRDVAQGCAVTALDSIEQGRWSTRYLVDGFDSHARLANFADPKVAASLALRSELAQSLRRAEDERSIAKDALTSASTKASLEEIEAALKEVAASRGRLPKPSLVYSVLPREPRPIHILARGEVEKPMEAVGPGTLSCLAGLPSEFSCPPSAPEGARRASLALWLSSPSNPLTWRSIVNRVWEYHFGRGIVDTPNDFGRNGSQPTHPDLLDWLATTFREGRGKREEGRDNPITSSPHQPLTASSLNCGQSLKRLHRLIVLSAAYRQSSRNDAAFAAHDGDNRLLWRMNRRRLDAEELRDSVLAISGKLDLTMGGRGFDLFRFKDDHSPVYDYTAPDIVDRPETWRRAIYAFTVRSVQNPFLESLDGADPNLLTPVRSSTLTALQALALLNDPFVLRQSQAFADRIKRDHTGLAEQVAAAYEMAFGRRPTPSEQSQLTQYALSHGLSAACRLLFNANEFVFLD